MLASECGSEFVVARSVDAYAGGCSVVFKMRCLSTPLDGIELPKVQVSSAKSCITSFNYPMSLPSSRDYRTWLTRMPGSQLWLT